MVLLAIVATVDPLSIFYLMIYLFPLFFRALKKLGEAPRGPGMLAGPLKRRCTQCWKILLAKSSILKLTPMPTCRNCSKQLWGSHLHNK